jgi:hypothetical protein
MRQTPVSKILVAKGGIEMGLLFILALLVFAMDLNGGF